MLNKLDLLGIECLQVQRLGAFVNYLDDEVRNGRGGFSVAVNAEKIIRASEYQEFKKLANLAKYPVVDGVGAQLTSLLLHGKRLIKIDLPSVVLSLCHTENYRLFVIGARESVNNRAYDLIRQDYSGIDLVGRINGFYEDEEYLFKALSNAEPQVVFLCLGTPKQENLAFKLSGLYPSMTFICCGGALDVLAGNVKRAPKMVQKSGFEWLYRLLQNPRRWQRQKKLPFLFILLIKRFLK